MIAFRRTEWNFALDRAIDHARDLGKPLVVLEPLRCGYRWASDRLHRFVIEGMAENRRRFAESPITHHPWLEREEGEGTGLLRALARRAAVVVTDDAPVFFLPRMVEAATASVGDDLGVRFEAIDANGMMPVRRPEKTFARAHDFRRFLQKTLPEHLDERPEPDPLSGLDLPTLDGLPDEVLERWPTVPDLEKAADPESLAELPIDHDVPPVESVEGGSAAARRVWEEFLGHRLDRYAEDRNAVEARVESGLSPYLHFGHVSTHEIFHGLAEREDWDPTRLSEDTRGSREGWWGMSASAEGFLDQILTWRELGYANAAREGAWDRWEDLPGWARKTLREHEDDPREHVYSLEEFETASTHDEIWNAAQRELRRDGKIHNYLRMLWGKKILEWTPTPRDALRVMLHLNDRWALDGRDPNSISGITWCLGRYDRAWGPERPIFGKIRFMSSANTRRKMDVSAYLDEFGA